MLLSAVESLEEAVCVRKRRVLPKNTHENEKRHLSYICLEKKNGLSLIFQEVRVADVGWPNNSSNILHLLYDAVARGGSQALQTYITRWPSLTRKVLYCPVNSELCWRSRSWKIAWLSQASWVKWVSWKYSLSGLTFTGYKLDGKNGSVLIYQSAYSAPCTESRRP